MQNDSEPKRMIRLSNKILKKNSAVDGGAVGACLKILSRNHGLVIACATAPIIGSAVSHWAGSPLALFGKFTVSRAATESEWLEQLKLMPGVSDTSAHIQTRVFALIERVD